MAKLYGQLPEAPPRNLLGALAAAVNPIARQKAELDAGAGLRRLLPLFELMPDHTAVILQPSLGFFMKVDCGIILPGRILVVQTVHWKGKILPGKNGEWLGANGTVDLGRPDRRAAQLADKLAYSGHAAGFEVDPVVVFTDGPVDFQGPEPVSLLVQWDEVSQFLRAMVPDEGSLPDMAPLVDLLGGR
jgi:hypothetical protein